MVTLTVQLDLNCEYILPNNPRRSWYCGCYISRAILCLSSPCLLFFRGRRDRIALSTPVELAEVASQSFPTPALCGEMAANATQATPASNW